MKGGIPEEKIAEIKEKARLVEVVSDHVSLRKAGKTIWVCARFTRSEPLPSR
jgi:DNA primase